MQKSISKILMSAIVACSLSPAMSQWTTTGTVIAPTVLTNNVSVGTTVNGANIYAQKTNAVTLGIKSQTAGATMFMDKGSATANAAFAYRFLGTTLWNTGMLGGNNYSIRNVANNTFPVVVAQNDNVGLGTLTPQSKLDIAGLSNWDLTNTPGDFRIGNDTYNFKLGVALAGGGSGNVHMAASTLFIMGTGTTQPNLNTLTIGGGQVGIGVLYPTAKLDVAGDVKINGIIVGKGNGSIANNTVVGDGALAANSGAGANTAIGYSAQHVNTIGYANTSIGAYSMLNNVDGFSNTALGSESLRDNTSGYFNTAIGQASLASAQGFDNTAVGRYALLTASAGNSNSAFGSAANLNDSSLSNVTLLGFYTVGTANNSVQIGNNAVTSVKAGNNVVIVSDGRFKKNVHENVPGLAFINKLKPVTYNYDVTGLDAFQRNGAASSNEKMMSDAASKQYAEAAAKKEKLIYSGFIAQDVEKAAQKLGYDFSGVYKPQGEKDPYGLSYAEFVVPIVKAVQELDAKNKNAELENAELKSKNQSLENRLNEIQQCLENLCNTPTQDKASNFKLPSPNFLAQNQPNPFNQSTAITYSLNSDAASAQIVIRNLNGEQIKAIAINKTGKGQVTINANELAQGTYTYTLIVNNQSVDTKLMVVTM